MSGGSWAAAADRVLRDVFGALPPDATEQDVARAVRDAYPFGERAMHPYKVWLARVKVWRDAWRKGYRLPSPSARPRRDMHEIDHDTVDLFADDVRRDHSPHRFAGACL